MLRRAAEKRGVKVIWHFTRLENLEAILAEGLLPRDRLEARDNPPVFNDSYRIDRQRGAICCSAGFPNYKMFYHLRCEDPDREWAVLALNGSTIWEKDCAFCRENAASAKVTALSLDHRKGAEAFEEMYSDYPGQVPRSELALPDEYPTNPQAEILVLEPIEPTCIRGIAVKKQSERDWLIARHPNIRVKYVPALFGPRRDHGHW